MKSPTRFRIRTLMAVVLVVAVMLGTARWTSNRYGRWLTWGPVTFGYVAESRGASRMLVAAWTSDTTWSGR